MMEAMRSWSLKKACKKWIYTLYEMEISNNKPLHKNFLIISNNGNSKSRSSQTFPRINFSLSSSSWLYILRKLELGANFTLYSSKVRIERSNFRNGISYNRNTISRTFEICLKLLIVIEFRSDKLLTDL